jgi:hypothetical protein
MKKLFKYWPLLAILALSSLIVWPLFMPGYFTHHDDLQVMRIFEMKKCLQDLQIPCRFVPDMGYGNGYPLFNYYNPLPYYIGGVLSFFLSYLLSAKILFFIPLLLAGLSMYLLVKEILDKQAAFLAAVLYLFAPYRALDSYVRGAVAESFAIALIPLVLYFALKLIKNASRKYLIYFSVSLAAFLTSHTIMTLLFTPLLLFMVIYWMRTERKGRYVIYGLLLGFGLSAFFTLPAYFEKNLVQIDNLTKLDLDFRAHFVTLPQLFLDRSWGYGASFPGPLDSISFQIGWPHWILALLSLPVAFFLRRKDKKVFFYLGILGFFVFSIFMTHNKSALIWEKIGLLRFTQFPWRMLSVAIFTSSLLGGFLVFGLNRYLKNIVIILLVLITVILNWSYFRPEKFIFNLTDQQKLSGRLWETQQKASILDYLPVGAGEPIEPAPPKPIIRSGQVDIKNFEKKSNSFKLDLEVKSPAKIEVPIMDFPNWIVFRNGSRINYTNDNYVRRISLDVPAGTYQFLGRFTDTPIRKVSNMLTLISLIIILYLGFYGKIRKNYQ